MEFSKIISIKLGAYHPFDRTYKEGIVPRMANQIWTLAYLKEHIFDKANTYAIAYDENPELTEEPEIEYGSTDLDEWDYLE